MYLCTTAERPAYIRSVKSSKILIRIGLARMLVDIVTYVRGTTSELKSVCAASTSNVSLAIFRILAFPDARLPANVEVIKFR
jgi:hypothetical protein